METSVNVIVGAKETGYPGWISTDGNFGNNRLDVRRREDWRRKFAPHSIDRIVCEHMLEHLTPEDATLALRNASEFLRPGGRLRIAVPDAFNPDRDYQEFARPFGPGDTLRRVFFYAPGEPCHLFHWDVESLSSALRAAGFSVRPLEWFDRSGEFHQEDFSNDDGPIRRRAGALYNVWWEWFYGFPNLSLIVDGVNN